MIQHPTGTGEHQSRTPQRRRLQFELQEAPFLPQNRAGLCPFCPSRGGWHLAGEAERDQQSSAPGSAREKQDEIPAWPWSWQGAQGIQEQHRAASLSPATQGHSCCQTPEPPAGPRHPAGSAPTGRQHLSVPSSPGRLAPLFPDFLVLAARHPDIHGDTTSPPPSFPAHKTVPSPLWQQRAAHS